MLGSYGYATVAISGINAALASGLLAVYARIYLRHRALFTLGLVVFAAAFVLQNVVTAMMFALYMEMVPDLLAPFLLVSGIAELVGLGVMLQSALT